MTNESAEPLEPPNASMTVGTYNIHHGAPIGKQLPQLRATEHAVANLQVDILALQEVDHRASRTYRQNQTGRLAKAANLQPIFMPVKRMAGGWYGISLLTKGPLLAYQMMQLPVTRGREQRGAILFSYQLGDQVISGAATHLQAVKPSERHRPEAASQLKVLLSELMKWPGPHLILGDFNLRPEAAIPILDAFGFTHSPSEPTFPSTKPTIKIDWIATKGLDVSSGEVGTTMASDHRPLTARVSLPIGSPHPLPNA